MKYLLLILLVLVVIWALKRNRRDTPAPPPQDSPNQPSNMVACTHCGIHLPQDETVNGEKGVYCSTDHRTAAQDRNPS
ncbi:PP0621 family protein [Limnohabitans sp. 2KL-3]|jgi:uncharacterized protein|uniref:PP0621 family protein n=1 Tax=Limnohabitans sp. 2KL-3 TaxID=1100700 RepID=UPI000AFAD605|nr:PP0621 family protein [Limnohabitans sp. 2KL-3]